MIIYVFAYIPIVSALLILKLKPNDNKLPLSTCLVVGGVTGLVCATMIASPVYLEEFQTGNFSSNTNTVVLAWLIVLATYGILCATLMYYLRICS